MHTIYRETWFDFVNYIEKNLQQSSDYIGYPSWYRGHPDANWQLKPTLERSTGVNLEVSTYCQMIENIQSAIETFTDKKWTLPSCEEFLSSLKNKSWNRDSSIHFQYMGYLRHYGFPSPLLDWTQSPFVAAFFAYKDVTSDAKSVAIYSYMESWEQPEITRTDKSQIYTVHTHSRNNPRYFLQQGVFTVCLKNIDGKIYFSSHEDPNLMSEDNGAYISKIEIPASERVNALHNLDTLNINSYSLFGSEESLLETLFLRKYVRAQRQIRAYADQDASDMWKLG
jgi:hypothetical protein